MMAVCLAYPVAWLLMTACCLGPWTWRITRVLRRLASCLLVFRPLTLRQRPLLRRRRGLFRFRLSGRHCRRGLRTSGRSSLRRVWQTLGRRRQLGFRRRRIAGLSIRKPISLCLLCRMPQATSAQKERCPRYQRERCPSQRLIARVVGGEISGEAHRSWRLRVHPCRPS